MRCLFFILAATLFSAEPPREIPQELIAEFTLNHRVGVSPYYFNHAYSSNEPLVYDIEMVETLIQKALRREENYYGPTDTYLYRVLNRYVSHIKGKRVAVIGSTTPWYEAIVLAYGGTPITIDYNKIVSEHPGLHPITIAEYDANPELFDAVLAISSYEHDGLGRYGDPINPKGDLEAMAKAQKMLKPGGLLFIALPVGIDHIYWNAHRVYGRLRMPLLFSGWDVVDSEGYHPRDLEQFSNGWHQPLFILKLKN